MSASILEPISSDNLVGKDCRYHDEYIFIDAEISKIGSLNDEVKPNWQKIIKQSEKVLTSLSKDIKVLSWWLVAVYKDNSFDKFLSSLKLYNNFLEKYNTDAYPKTLNAKLNTLEWIELILEKDFIEDNQLTVPQSYIEQLYNQIQKTKSLAQEITQNKKLFFKPLHELLYKHIESKKKKEEASKQEISCNNKNDQSIQNDSQALDILNQIKKKSSLLHKYWVEKDSFDIKALRIVRMISWLEIDDVPMNEHGKTMINPPSIERVEEVESLMNEEEYEQALMVLENMLLRMPFWLEGHYKVYELLNKAKKPKAAQEVMNFLIWFLHNNQELLHFKFNDESDIVPKNVKQVLIQANSLHTLVDDDNTHNNRFDETKVQVLHLMKKKKIAQAMIVLQDAYVNAYDENERFLLRILHAKTAIDSGKVQMALAFIEELENKIKQHKLEVWQPKLASEVYILLLKSFNKNLIERERINNIYQKLCLIAPSDAIDIKL